MRNRILLFGMLLVVAVVVYTSGAFQYLAPDRLRAFLSEAGAFGPILIILLFSFCEPFGAPGAIFLLAAATLWPFWLALLVNWLGAIGAGMVGFAFARFFGRDWAEHHMPDRLRKWDERLSEKGLPAVVLFRLLFFLNPASHWALGLSRVPFPTALFGTAIGFLPAVALWTYFGAEILIWFEAQSVGMWVAVAAAIVAFLVFRRFRRRAKVVDVA